MIHITNKLVKINYIIPLTEFHALQKVHTVKLTLANFVSQNIVGLSLKQLRRSRKLSQSMLAARCAVLGWDISQNTITKIENGFRCVADYELLTLARALKVSLAELLMEDFDLQPYLQARVKQKPENPPPFSEQEN